MLTEDVYPNRLEAGKRVLTNLIQSLKGDRVGFIPFSDSAYIQMPLTDDYNITQNYINAIDTTLISGGGTELYQALELAEKSFKEIGSENKTVIVISDGGDFDKKSLDFVKENKIDVYSIGVGTKEGNVIPEYLNGVKRGFIKDESGSAVISKLNSDFLQKISNENNGKYYEVNNLVDTSKNFVNDTINLERKNQRNEKTKVHEYDGVGCFIADNLGRLFRRYGCFGRRESGRSESLYHSDHCRTEWCGGDKGLRSDGGY